MRNQFEKDTFKYLSKRKVSFTYETEKIPYILVCHYIPDFIVDVPNGKVYIECKGYLRPEDKRKLIAVKRQNPKLDIRILFYRCNKKQINWAVRNSFKYAIKTVPLDWLKGL